MVTIRLPTRNSLICSSLVGNSVSRNVSFGSSAKLSTGILTNTDSGSKTRATTLDVRRVKSNPSVVKGKIVMLQYSCNWLITRWMLSLLFSAPLITRHPSAESGQITSIFGEAIPKNFSLYFHVFSAFRSACVNYSRVSSLSRERWLRSMVIPRKLTDFFPEVPASEGAQ